MRVLGGRVEEVVKRNERDDGVDGGRADVEFLVPGRGNALWRRFVGEGGKIK